ncbi:MAG: hypothetical protein FWE36_04885 [Erysipelotrichales bacterium]|nr:hypothetical protein [Erysipelotrichales bacterium]
MSEKDLYNEAKKKLAKRFYLGYFAYLIITLSLAIGGIIGVLLHWDYYDTTTLMTVSFLAIILLFLSFFLIGIILKGKSRLKKNQIETIIGTVIEFRLTGNGDSAVWDYPVVRTSSGKMIKMKGLNSGKDGIEIGQKYKFLTMLGIEVKLNEISDEKPKEKQQTFK